MGIQQEHPHEQAGSINGVISPSRTSTSSRFNSLPIPFECNPLGPSQSGAAPGARGRMIGTFSLFQPDASVLADPWTKVSPALLYDVSGPSSSCNLKREEAASRWGFGQTACVEEETVARGAALSAVLCKRR